MTHWTQTRPQVGTIRDELGIQALIPHKHANGDEHTHGIIGAGQHEHVAGYSAAELSKQIGRLQMAAAWLATELDNDDPPPHQSAEDAIERILYPEHFRSPECIPSATAPVPTP